MKNPRDKRLSIHPFLIFAMILIFNSSCAEVIYKNSFEALYFVGGNSSDADVVLQLNQNPHYQISQTGAYVFPTAVENGSSYSIQVIQPPLNKTCMTTKTNGTITGADVSDVNVICGSNTTIYDVKQGVATGLVAIENVLLVSCWQNRGYTAQTLPADPSYIGDEFSGVYIVDNNADCDNVNQTPKPGNRVNLVGVAGDFFGQKQLSDTYFNVLSTDNLLPVPVNASTSSLATIGAAPLDAVLVVVNNVTVTDVDVPAVSGDSDPTNEYILNGELHVDDLLYLTSPFPQLNDVFASLTGIMTYRFNTSKLLPRYSSDAFLADPLADNLVINEVDYNQEDTDSVEFVELFNPTGQTVSLVNKTLYFVNGSSGHEYLPIDLDAYNELLSGQYLIVGSQALLDVIDNGSIEVPFANSENNIQNGPDGLLLIDRQTEVVEDVLSYAGEITAEINDLGGLMVNLVEGTATVATDVNSGIFALSRIPNGYDSNDAQTDWQLVANTTPGSANSTATILMGALVINEVDYDQIGADSEEFIEIYNPGSTSVSLDGISLYLINQSSNIYDTITLSDAGAALHAGEYLVVGSPIVIAGLPASTKYITFNNFIQNGESDGLLIFDDVNTTVLDALSYEGSLTAVDINGTVVSLVEGNATTVEDSNAITGSMIRLPNGSDSNDAATDWQFTTSITAGSENE